MFCIPIKKTKTIAALSIIAIGLLIAAQKEKIVLSSPVLKLMDGIPFALDGTTMRDMIHIRRQGRCIQYGVPDKSTKKLIGKYEYKGQCYSIHQLAQIERAIDEKYEALFADLDAQFVDMDRYDREWGRAHEELQIEHDKERVEKEQEVHRSLHKDADLDANTMKVYRKITKRYKRKCATTRSEIKRKHIENASEYDQKRAAIQADYDAEMAPLQECLKEARLDFKKINEPYMEQVKGTKSLLFKLVIESCHKRGRLDSFLLKWAEVEEGKEFVAFDKNMTNLQILDKFLDDLSYFFEDLINSCPKGWAQYLDLVKKQKNK